MTEFNLIEMLKASASRQVMSVDDFELTLAAVDVRGVNEIVARLSDEELASGAGYNVEGGVATIKVRGLLVPNLSYDLTDYGLTAYNYLTEYLTAANSDPNVTEIVFDIDSAGGFVKGLQATAEAISKSPKPTKTVATGTMASAAYWLGVSSDRVEAASGGNQIGSIGVYMSHTDMSENLKARGVNVTVFKSGFWKGAFANHKPLSDRESERLQQKVDDDAGVFFAHVADHRPQLSAADVKGLEGDTFTGTRALNLGLIDSISNNNSNVKPNKGQSAMSTFTQAELDAAKAQAREDALAEARVEASQAAVKATARTRLVYDHAKGNDALRALLTSEAFASVDDENLKAVLDALPETNVEAALDAQGGANVAVAPVTPSEASDDEDDKATKAKAVAEANQAVAKFGNMGL